MLLAATLFALSGCASTISVAPGESPPVPAAWSEKQSPDAKAFSEKVQSFLQRVETYFNETPTFTTPSPKP